MPTFHIYRFDPDHDAKPRMQELHIDTDPADRMLLDVLIKLKAIDPSLSFRNMTEFFKQYHSIKPYLQTDEPAPARERLQSPQQREALNGLYECIRCACCSSACPSFWWNPDKYVGPAGLLQAYRFLADSRDTATCERLDDLNDPFRLFRCRSILNCVDVCPKNLLSALAIMKIKNMMVRRAV